MSNHLAMNGFARTAFENLPVCGSISYITGWPASCASSINSFTCPFASNPVKSSMFLSSNAPLTSELFGRYAQPNSLG